mmetsp:Transcript_49639/g.106340  ORF Transcript_49639/g.106340 Transcript_49639/m.106340 type:complete len:634 (+) Transcript_49639:120-2021(+)
MVASILSFISWTTNALQEGPNNALAQEVLVLTVFLLSSLLWRRVSPWGKRTERRSPKLLQETDSASPQRTGSPVRQRGTREAVPAPRVAGPAAIAAAKVAEEQMLQQLEQRKEFTCALNTFRTMERDGRDLHFSERLYSAFIQSAVRVGKVDVVERMVRSMKRSKMAPSLAFWQTTLRMLSSRKHFGSCLVVHTIFGNQIPADKVSYSCLINAALEVGSPERAKAMLGKYSESGIDAKEHVLFFRIYVALNDTEEASALFKKLGSNMTSLMLNLLLLIYSNARQPDRGHAALHEAHLLEGSEPIVDVVSYNTVMKGFAQAGHGTKCVEVLQEMCTHSIEPDDITMATLVDACVADNNMEVAADIARRCQNSEKGMSTVISTVFMKGLVKANCLPKALDLYEDMKHHKCGGPDIIMFSVLIKALVDQHDLDRAVSLKEDMLAAGLVPDDIIVTHLLEGCRHAGNHALGMRLFEEMLASGLIPSEFTLVTMLKLHGRCGAHKEAYELVEGWEAKYGKTPSVIHYTCLMSGCLRTRNYDQAWASYELMRLNSVPLDETMVAILLPGMIAAQNWDRVMDIVRTALKGPRPIAVPPEAMNNAYSQMMADQGQARLAMELRQHMLSLGVAITTRRARRP